MLFRNTNPSVAEYDVHIALLVSCGNADCAFRCELDRVAE